MPRRRSFDPDEALQRAMILFWERGFEAASVQSLTNTMGINRFSMYNTFGDKQALYLAALDRYAEQYAAAVLAPLREEQVGLSHIHTYFKLLFAQLQQPPGSLGCLLVLAGAERRDDAPTRQRVDDHRGRTRIGFERALRQAADKDTLRHDIYPRRRATALTTFAQGLTLQARAGVDLRALRAATDAVLEDLQPG